MQYLTLEQTRVLNVKIQERFQISFSRILKKKMVPCKSSGEEVSFEFE